MNITNIGTSQTIIKTPGSSPDRTNETSWQAEYDGKRANLLIETITNGNKQYSELTFTNAELENINGVMNLPKQVGRLDARLEKDYSVRVKKTAFTHPFTIRTRDPKKYPVTPKHTHTRGGNGIKRARKTRIKQGKSRKRVDRTRRHKTRRHS